MFFLVGTTNFWDIIANLSTNLDIKSPWDLIKTIIDIGIVSFVIYKLIKLIRETRAWQLIKGILVIVIAARASELIGLKLCLLY